MLLVDISSQHIQDLWSGSSVPDVNLADRQFKVFNFFFFLFFCFCFIWACLSYIIEFKAIKYLMLYLWVNIFAHRFLFSGTERPLREISGLHRHSMDVFMYILGTGFLCSLVWEVCLYNRGLQRPSEPVKGLAWLRWHGTGLSSGTRGLARWCSRGSQGQLVNSLKIALLWLRL